MNTPWRSSFHHFDVAISGTRRSTSRARARAARRTSVNVHSGRIRTFTWIPFFPLVFGKPTSPCSSSTSRVTIATSRTCSNGTSGMGSRSTRSSSGWSTSSERTGQGLISRQPRVAAHARCAASAITGMSAVRPLGNRIRAVSTHGGAPFGRRFW